MSKAWGLNLENEHFGDLVVVGQPVVQGTQRMWPCQCMRPIHKGEVVIRHAATGKLRANLIRACTPCMRDDLMKVPEGPRVEEIEPRPEARKVCLPTCTRYGAMVGHQPDCPVVRPQ